jgi:hypothetical protein
MDAYEYTQHTRHCVLMVKKNSVEVYLTNLINLIKKSGSEDAEKIMKWVLDQDIKTRTKHNYLNSIVSVHKHRPDLVKGNVEKVKAERDKLQSEINNTVKENNLTDRQRAVMDEVSWSDIEAVRDKLNQQKDQSAKSLEDYVLISLMIPPLRNDLQEVRVSRNSRDCKDNCILIPKRKGGGVTLYVRDHKTSSRGGKPIIRKLSPELSADVSKLASDGRSHLFVDRTGKPFTSSGFTHRLNAVFQKHLPNGKGLKISSTLLRKMYLTDKYKEYKKVAKEMEKDAEQMGHSVGTQQAHYVDNGDD